MSDPPATSKREEVVAVIQQIGVPAHPKQTEGGESGSDGGGVRKEEDGLTNEELLQSFAASVSRTISRGMAFYFKNPVKLFRPAVIETLHLAKTRAGRAVATSEVTLLPGSLHAIFHGVRVDGYKQFTVNVLPAFTLNVLLGTAMFATYEISSDLLAPMLPITNYQSTAVHAFAAGSLAGVTQACFAAPLDVVNVHIWLQRESPEKLTLYRQLKGLAKARGIPFLYQHFPLTLLRDCLGLGVFFMTFETIKRATASERPSFFLQNSLAVLFSGAMAGLMHQAVFHPTDILKRTLIEERDRNKLPAPRLHHLWGHFKEQVIRKHGVRFLFRGYLNSITKAMPPAAVGFLVYEATAKEFELKGGLSS